MRKLEKQMLNAIHTRKDWTLKNTRVQIDWLNDAKRAAVFLHENHIATITLRNGIAAAWLVEVNKATLANWPSTTTKSRLRALGVDVYTRNHVIYLDGQPVA